jgi:hypothetical protein
MFTRSGSLFLMLLSLILLGSCDSDKKIDTDPGTAYYDYMIWGDEESGLVTVKLQYRSGGPNGESFRLDEGAKVELDGEQLDADTAGLNGTYYELIRPVPEFVGKHIVKTTGKDGAVFQVEFEFIPIVLKTQLPALAGRDSLVLELDGLQPKDTVRVLLTDTSFYGNGIEHVGRLQKGRAILRHFGDLKSGPVYIELIKEQVIPLSASKAGGRLSVTYGLKREFILADSIRADSLR